MSCEIQIAKNAIECGSLAATKIALLINQAIKDKGKARIALSTGQSQFEMFNALVTKDVDWSRVEMFHLDEYVGLDDNHVASFRRYLRERFVNKLKLLSVNYVTTEDALPSLIEKLEAEEIDVGVIGIGENGHIAFNDPPADFDTTISYKVVSLDNRCRMQQVNEGWFSNLDEVPKKAITMTPKRIMMSKHIISVVPHKVKAEAIYNTLTNDKDPNIPATILKSHENWSLFLDKESASLWYK